MKFLGSKIPGQFGRYKDEYKLTRKILLEEAGRIGLLESDFGIGEE